MHKGRYSVIKASGEKEIGVSQTGAVPTQFYRGISGQFDFQKRLIASYRSQDASISGHHSTGALRGKIPAHVKKSLANIEQYLPSGGRHGS